MKYWTLLSPLDGLSNKSLHLSDRSSVVEPVNSLRQKLQNRAVMKEGWEQSLNATYRDRKSSNAELVRQEKAK